MDLQSLQTKIKEAREQSKKRNFTQTFDIIINLKNLDLKKPDHKVDVGVTLTAPCKATKLKICAIVDHSVSDAEKVFDHVLYNDELQNLKGNMTEIRKITHGYDRFVVQASYMPLFAQVLGRYLGPMNKMPSPKLGMVITDKTPIKELYEKLQKTVQLQTRKNLVLQAPIGSEKESDETIAKHINAIEETLLHALPQQKENVKNFGVKLSMGKLVVL